jgi:cadmium resistance protein CadD (predicted permease)
VLTLTGLVFGTFIATNIDNLLLLVMLLGANPNRRLAVLGGFLVSCAAVLGACAAALVLSAFFQPDVLGYLGLAPLLMGIHMLYQLYTRDTVEQTQVELESSDSPARILLASFLLLFSNSSDSIAVFLPLFAESNRASTPVLLSAYLAVAILWGILSYSIAGRKELALLIEHRAEKLVPWIMIGVGIYILMDTATDTLL